MRSPPRAGRVTSSLESGHPCGTQALQGRTRLQFQGRAACGCTQAWAQGGLCEDGAPAGQEGSPEPPQPSPSTSDIGVAQTTPEKRKTGDFM